MTDYFYRPRDKMALHTSPSWIEHRLNVSTIAINILRPE